MSNFRIFTTEEFDKDYSKLDKSEKNRVKKFMKQLKKQVDRVGKPLSGLSFFREKKFGVKRSYFLVYKDLSVILTLGIGDKKAQQSTVNRILLELDEYQQSVFKTLKKKGVL